MSAGTPEQPMEEFVGSKGGSLSSQLTPRTILLLVLALFSLVFAIYQNSHKNKPIVPQPKQFEHVTQSDVASMPVMPTLADVSDVDMDILIEDGKKLYSAGKIDEALSKFMSASVKDPANAVVLNNMGLIYKKKGDVAQAEGLYKKALSLKPDYPEAYNNLGVLKAAAGDTLSASVYLKRAIKSQPEYADAYFNIAVLNEGEGNLREAILNYKLFLQYTDSGDESLISKIKQRIEQLSE